MKQKDDLKKPLGLASIIFLGMNSILGTGIFFLPSQAMALAGPFSLFIYLFVSLAAIVIAFCFAECASLISRNGAAYVYAKEAFGDFVGFEVGLMKWGSSIIGAAALAVGLATVLEHLFPVLSSSLFHVFLLIAIIGSLSVLNIFGVGLFKLINNCAACAKLFLLFLFIGFGSFYIDVSHFTPFTPENLSFEDVGSASMAVFFGFSGFEGLAVASEEMENPRRNLPTAIFVVLIMTSLIYFMVQGILIGILGPVLAETSVPFAKAAESLGGPLGELAVLLFMLIATIGTNITASFSAPRSAVALAQDNMLPAGMASLGRFGTPSIAIGITAILTFLIAVSGSFAFLAGISVFIRLIQYFPTCFAVLIFRFSRPDLVSSFHPVLSSVVSLLALFILGWLAINASFQAMIFGTLVLLSGVPIYLMMAPKLSTAA